MVKVAITYSCDQLHWILLEHYILKDAELFQMQQYKIYGGAYSSFAGCPASKGILQFDMWGVTPSNRYDWNSLKQSIINHGLRNSLLVAPMPTASTSVKFWEIMNVLNHLLVIFMYDALLRVNLLL